MERSPPGRRDRIVAPPRQRREEAHGGLWVELGAPPRPPLKPPLGRSRRARRKRGAVSTETSCPPAAAPDACGPDEAPLPSARGPGKEGERGGWGGVGGGPLGAASPPHRASQKSALRGTKATEVACDCPSRGNAGVSD